MNEQFGRYTLLERVAIGGMAEIFRASASGFGGFEKILAIKRLHPRFSQDADFIEMLIDEARITVELTHSNIVQIYDLGKLEDHYYIAMEYIDGKDLYRAMRRLTDQRLVFPIDAAAYIAMEALAGLDYAHRKNDSRGRPLSIIHRDISPQNILLSFEGDVKVVDFGIAKAATRATETESGIIKGKFYYMSPEQAKGERLDHRTDIFSLGILFYEMLTGELLYKDEDDVNLLSRVRRADIDLPSRVRPEIPTELEDIVMKALAREREDRYPSAQHMQRDLERFLRDYGTMFNKSHLSQLMQVLFDEAQDQRAGDLLQGRDDYIIDNQSVIMRIPEVEDHGSMEPEFISELMELGDDEMEVVEDPSYRSAYAQPSYEQPQPGYAQPSYEQPQPGYAQPSYEQPQPAYEQPSYEQPQPAYAQPQPNYAQPQPNYEPQQPSYAQPAYEQPPSYAQPSPQGGQARADFAVGHQVVGADYDSIAASFPGDDPFEAEETRAFDPPPRGAARAIEPARAQPLSPPRAEPLPSPRAAAPAAPRANAGRMSIAQQRLSGQPRAGLASPPPRGVAESARAFHRQPTLIVKNPVAEPAQPAPAYDQGTPVRRAPVGLESRGVLTKERALMALALLGVIGLAWGATALLVGTPEEEGKPVVVVSEPAARQQTTLSIASSPSGAEVKLDGRALYESTPTQREVPPNQPLKVEILAEGYRPYETTVTLREGQTLALNPQLEARLGTLSIESDPSEASVYLNDRYVGRTPHTESEVSMKGPARLRLEKPGYLPREKTAEWEGHQTINLRLKLVAEPAAVAQLTPPPAAPEPPVASKKKKPRRRRRATPRPPDPPPRREEAPPPPPPPPRQEVGEGFLSVSSTPWGSVYLNGKLIANETPMIRQRVPEGSHRVYICYERNCNDRSGVKPARITAGRNTILKF